MAGASQQISGSAKKISGSGQDHLGPGSGTTARAAALLSEAEHIEVLALDGISVPGQLSYVVEDMDEAA